MRETKKRSTRFNLFIANNQIKNRHIGKSRRSIFSVTEITKIKKLERFIFTKAIDSEFDSVDQNFLISTLEIYGFGENFILGVKILLRDQELCVINNGTNTKYFSFGRGTHQGSPISDFLFVLALEIIFLLTKLKHEIEGITIFNHNYLYSAYADDRAYVVQHILFL